MKNLLYSVALCLSVLFVLAHINEAVIPCGTVDMKAAACISFTTGKDAKPSAPCCSGLQQLARSVKSVDDKKDICRCLKAGVTNFAGVQDKFLSQLPTACTIKVGFPVSMNTNCETIRM
ncbi:non-specific lipid-transfer protein C, cotyledon-specific isoform-like [Nicotiana tabacum]|uniref:Non-specific lipid-transfer protein n=1 Tax=Nicotiana tabacum TaxID=4097 RepID=A0A1S4AST2_TOBAC|nr:PREDICTED: non-specific lipid-transfer protein C, cotyledon-specific isoform-like [Nicotiana tabacum]